MPSQPTGKRIKNKRFTRYIIIGSEARNLPPVGDPKRDAKIPEQHTKQWTIYVRAPENSPDLRTWLSKVTIKIHADYDKPLRQLDNPPYEVSETGWGGFNYDVRLFFRPESTEKPQYRTHYLQLEPFGKDAEKQQKEGLVRAEALEEVNFNEPVDIFAHMLTSESQFDIMRDVKQQTAQWGAHVVKARKKMLAPAEGSAQLSVRASEVAPFTQEQEDLLVRHIDEKQAEVDRMLAEENEKKDKIHQKLLELREYMGPAASAQAAKEASGDRVRRR